MEEKHGLERGGREGKRRQVGVEAHGIRLPVIQRGDDLVRIVAESLIEAAHSPYAPFTLRDRDVVAVTESLLARAQGNIVSLDDIAADVAGKLDSDEVAVAFPILSRNRFLPLFRALTKAIRGRVHLFLSCPADEVGNHLVDPMEYLKHASGLPECFGLDEFRRRFGEYRHPFTGVDYVELYRGVAPDRIEVHFTNNPLNVLKATKCVIMANIHQRGTYAALLREQGASVLTLDQICNAPLRDGGGYNAEFGLLGSNFSKEGSVKLFPRDAERFALDLQQEVLRRSGRRVEAMVYGDGAFKDPACGIWELADPVVSPGFTEGLRGTPSEIKFKMVADNASGDAEVAVREAIRSKPAPGGKESGLTESRNALGTTPRRYTDLLGSLCDLVSGSGDRGTPVVHVSGYFDSWNDE